MLRYRGRDLGAPVCQYERMKHLALLGLGLTLSGCDALRAWVVEVYPMKYEPPSPAEAARVTGEPWPDGFPKFGGSDEARDRVSIRLVPVLEGLKQPTDLVFFPGSTSSGLVLEKQGRLSQFDLDQASLKPLLTMDVLTESEQGLLGIALHPTFSETGRLYIHASVRDGSDEVGEISAWTLSPAKDSLTREGRIMAVVQPYANHNAGQLQFGPDGMLYIGMGDGGWRDDPHNHGQRTDTLLGSMLRIDVDAPDAGRAYAIPPDNPWADGQGAAPEAWAVGIRNPWKFSFAPDGRMLLADVGQNAWEEVNLVSAGDNLGWKVKEASHCGPKRETCVDPTLVDPIFEYPHDMGSSITGGYVETSGTIPGIEQHYVFADFVSGRLWAIPLPTSDAQGMVNAKALGQWPFLPSTFGQASDGTLYVAGFGRGTLYRLSPEVKPG